MSLSNHQFDSYASEYKDIVKKSVGIIPTQEDFYLKSKIDMLSGYIKKLPSKSYVMDFGCGVGSLVVPLSKLFPEIIFYAYDPSAESVSKIQDQKLLNVITCSDESLLSSIDLKSKFSLVFCINVFHHIEFGERSSKVALLKGTLKPGSQLIILEHNPINPLTQIVVSRCEFDRGVKLLSHRELKNLFFQNSIVVNRHWFIVFFPIHNRFFSGIEKLISFFPLGAQQCIEGTICK